MLHIRFVRLRRTVSEVTLTATILAVVATPAAAAATRCVNTGGTGSCFGSISAAVTASSAGDVVNVAHGTYREDVVITKAISLIGQNKENTIIDATGKLNGIEISGTNGVVVSGFTVKNANAAGIWITNSSNVTISDNAIVANDKGLVPGSNGADSTCPPLDGTVFEKGEAEDCGEGVFLSGVDHSIIANNTVTQNAGGILITDDTGATHDNLISNNSVVRNTALDCGITLPSHSGFGVYNNTVVGNDSSYNGGPGVGIFAPIPGSKAYGNRVINNRLRYNGLPGVTMHNHVGPGMGPFPPNAPMPMFNDNVIVGNEIAANSQDFEDAATPGPTGINIYSVVPMSGTVISQNVIRQESYDIFVKVPANAEGFPAAEIRLNNLLGNNVGVMNTGAAPVDARMNWWGCGNGPNANGCSSVSGAVLYVPWLGQPFQSEQ